MRNLCHSGFTFHHVFYSPIISFEGENPITGEMIPMIGDSNCESYKGTGVLPLMPAHNFDDYGIAIGYKYKPTK